MAICGFRAENFPFGLLEGEGLREILALLERAEKGFAAAEVSVDRAGAIEALRRSGIIVVLGERVLLGQQGADLLKALRELLGQGCPRAPVDPSENGA